MNKDLHDIDEMFRAGLEEYKETPSAGVKENIDAALDKQDAEKYKKRFILWKRAALLLLLLLAGLMLYESGIIKTGGNGPVAKTSVPVKNDKAEAKTETVNSNNNTPVNSPNATVISDETISQKKNAESQQIQKEITNVPDGSIVTVKKSIDKKITWSKNNRPGKQFNRFITAKDLFVSITSSQQDKKINTTIGYDADLQTSKRGITPLDERTSVSKVAGRFIKSIQPISAITVSNSPLKANNANDSKSKKVKSFKPFWLVAPFASYEQSGYRLDSDNPITANVIKHREVNEPSFSGGILVTRQFNRHWGLQSGLTYTSTQIGISPQKMYALQLPGGDVAYKFITSSGYAYIKLGIGQPPAVGDSITTSDAKHLLKHISIPVAIKYSMGKNKFTVSPSVGIEANIISSAKVEVGVDLASNREIVSVNKMEGIKSFYWSAVTGVEASYQVSKKMSVNVQPVFRYALSPITKNNVVETFPRSFGIRAGVTIKF